MSQKYFTTLTNIGAALHANAQLQQTTVPWTHLVLGDGNGVEPVPSPTQTGVIREVDRLAISSIETDPNNPNWIVIEAVIPADRGGYVVRETALMGTAGGNQCIAVGNYPSATKPLLSEGAGSELVIRMVVEIAHTATVTLKIDPAVVIASRDWVEKQHATQQKRGLVELATSLEASEGLSPSLAVTPEGLGQFFRPPTESLIGMPKKSSAALAKGLADDATMLTPAMLAAALRINPSHTPLAYDTFPMLGKSMMKIGRFTGATGASGSAVFTFPEAFPTDLLFVAVFDETTSPSTIVPIAVDSSAHTRTSFTYRWNGAVAGGAGGISYLAIGY